jgi:hypothetical protein
MYNMNLNKYETDYAFLIVTKLHSSHLSIMLF